MNRRAKTQGFTLIEALIGIILLILVSTYASLTIMRAQTVDNDLAGQAGASMVLNFLADRLAEGDRKYAPVGQSSKYDWNYGDLTEPFKASQGQDYADPKLYRVTVQNVAPTPVKIGTDTTNLNEYDATVCWKTINDLTEQCHDRVVLGPVN